MIDYGKESARFPLSLFPLSLIFMLRHSKQEECYDLNFRLSNDPATASCYEFIWPYGPDTTPAGGIMCHYCCNDESFPTDLCNTPPFGWFYEEPPINNWDPRMKWDLTMDYVTPTPPSAAVRQLPSLGLAGTLCSLFMAMILH